MASVTRLESGNRQGFRIRFYVDKRRRELYVAGLSKRSERQAGLIAQHVEELAQAVGRNITPAAASVEWANGTKGKLRDNLVDWRLAEPITPKLSTDEGRLLGPFCDSYINGRTDLRRGTLTNYRQVRRLLVEYFGASRPLRDITPADADRWRRWLLARVVKPATDGTPAQTMAVATVSKHVKRAKTVFAEAVADRLLAESPFAKLKGGDESNPDRQRFITPEVSARILEACPDAEWRCVFALARWCGMRCPSEVLGLRWTDIDWAGGRLRIDSPKTGLRFCPLFPEARVVLSEAYGLAADGAEHVVARYQWADNLRTQFCRIVERAGVVPWPKPFINLRSTRRTELQERFPDHVVNAWLGQSSAVAAKHYLQVTTDHWRQAAEAGPPMDRTNRSEEREKLDSGSPTGPPIAAHFGPSRPIAETKKPRELRGSEGGRWVPMDSGMTPTGLEPVLPP